MTKRRLAISILATAALLVPAVLGGLYWASQQVPAFYAAAAAPRDAAETKAASDAMLRQSASLASRARRRGQWQAIFSADEINGWLEVDARENHPELFPPEVSHPRVAIDTNRVQVGFRWDSAKLSTVVSFEAEVYLREENVVAIHVRHARAGSLPLPLGEVLNQLVAAGREFGVEIEQRTADGDPLLLVTLPPAYDERDNQLWLEALELRAGEIFLAGRTLRAGEVPPLAARDRPTTYEADGPTRQNVQR